MNHGFYILDASGERPIPCDDPAAWADWYSTSLTRWVARAFLADGTIAISTVFLGVDHSLEGPPILWETMVFRIKDGDMDGTMDCERCAGNREQALALHADMCKRVKALLERRAVAS